jgi:DNA-binding response OmpR family regulator
VSELPVILVIEDEYPLQGIVEDALTDGGFAADILSSGEEALTVFKGRHKKYKALVTDVVLKGRLNGWEVAAQLREVDPQIPVVYMSGAHADEWASKGVPKSIMLTKPFAPAQLVTAVSQLLNDVPPMLPWSRAYLVAVSRVFWNSPPRFLVSLSRGGEERGPQGDRVFRCSDRQRLEMDRVSGCNQNADGNGTNQAPRHFGCRACDRHGL